MTNERLTSEYASDVSSAEEALARLVPEILYRDCEIDEADVLIDPAHALRQAQETLRRERADNNRVLEQLNSIQTSRAWRLAKVLRRVRQIAAPPGSLRTRLAGKMWRFLRGKRSPTLPPAVRSEHMEALRQRCGPDRELFIFLPSIPWNVDLFQRPQHLARHLAQAGHLVVYDCSGSSENMAGLVEREPNLFLYKGDLQPLAELPDPILWAFTYNYSMREHYPAKCRVVYDWIDDLSVFPYDPTMLRRNHQRALREATVVTSVARKLHEAALQVRPDALYLPNAVEFERFAASAQKMPADAVLRALVAAGKPIAGYYGALASWFDYPLLEEAAMRRPDWNFLLIGPDYDGSLPGHSLLQRPNVYWLGPRPYEELPAYLQAMTCAMIPFQLNDITVATSPLKLYEYLAGGKPVITTAMPECQAHPEVNIVHSVSEFVAALDKLREEEESQSRRAAYQAVGKTNAWTARTTLVLDRLRALRPVVHFRTKKNRRFFQALTAFFDGARDNPCYPLWFEYAVTTNERGQSVAVTLAQHTVLEGKDYLDVGCAYGGFLVAFAQRGARVQGLDVDSALLGLARQNLSAQEIDAPLLQLNATAAETALRFRNSQDVITCNDVIEHVDDPKALVENLAAMLRPGGWLYMEIPNKDYPPYVVEDGHFRMFGITLLEHEEARAYYETLNLSNVYTVGHYLTLSQYFALLEGTGLRVQLLEQCVGNANLDVVLGAVQTLEEQAEKRLELVPADLRTRVADELGRYLTELNATPRQTDAERRAFLIRYGVSFWQILVYKPAS